jgi:hypothetical protein
VGKGKKEKQNLLFEFIFISAFEGTGRGDKYKAGRRESSRKPPPSHGEGEQVFLFPYF